VKLFDDKILSIFDFFANFIAQNIWAIAKHDDGKHSILIIFGSNSAQIIVAQVGRI
jgi:hypothetical protein